MENSVSIYDLSPISDFLSKILPAMGLLNVYMQMANETNRIDVKKTELAAALGKSRRTISEWIRILARVGAIKYKYSGSACLNPFIYYKGTAQNYERAKETWNQFKSDIKAI